MQEIIFKYLDRHYEIVKDYQTNVDYNIIRKRGRIMYFTKLVDELSVIFDVDVYIVCDYVYEWGKDYDLDHYYSLPAMPELRYGSCIKHLYGFKS